MSLLLYGTLLICHLFTMPFIRYVTHSVCHFFICHSFDMSFLHLPLFQYVTLLIWHSFSMSLFWYVTLLICHSFDMSVFQYITLLNCSQWSHSDRVIGVTPWRCAEFIYKPPEIKNENIRKHYIPQENKDRAFKMSASKVLWSA